MRSAEIGWISLFLSLSHPGGLKGIKDTLGISSAVGVYKNLEE
jgi:hypothetical protein